MNLRSPWLWIGGGIAVIVVGILVAGAISDAGLTDRAQDAVRAQLKDPDSAQFTMARDMDSADRRLFCGCVNAKNSFGGYGGAHPFIAYGGKDGQWHALIGSDDLTDGALSKTCAASGHIVDCASTP